MFTIGITKGRWNTLVTALQQFKDDYDKNQPLWKVLPEFVQKNPRYERIGLRDLCTQIHRVYKENDVARLTTEMYLSDMVPAMRPADAFAKMAHREIERVRLAIDMAESGRDVALVSSGDAGVYGMAGLALEAALAGINPDALSPREALDALYQLKKMAGA
jgi:hypothetical protein